MQRYEKTKRVVNLTTALSESYKAQLDLMNNSSMMIPVFALQIKTNCAFMTSGPVGQEVILWTWRTSDSRLPWEQVSPPPTNRRLELTKATRPWSKNKAKRKNCEYLQATERVRPFFPIFVFQLCILGPHPHEETQHIDPHRRHNHKLHWGLIRLRVRTDQCG